MNKSFVETIIEKKVFVIIVIVLLMLLGIYSYKHPETKLS